MEKKELYMAPAIEDVESRLACAVAQGASVEGGPGSESNPDDDL